MYYLLPITAQRVESIFFFFSNRCEAFSESGATAPITSSVGRSEAPKALSESHRSLPQENPAAVSDSLPRFFNIILWRKYIEKLYLKLNLVIFLQSAKRERPFICFSSIVFNFKSISPILSFSFIVDFNSLSISRFFFFLVF